MSFVILGFCDQWDEFERRDYALMTRLAEYPDVAKIIYVQPPLTLTSLAKFVFGRADLYASLGWKQFFSNGMVHKKGKIAILHTFSVLPLFGNRLIHNINVRLMNWMRIHCVKSVMADVSICGRIVLWISNPYFNSDLIGKFNERLVCYNLCEDYVAKHPDPDQRRLLETEDEAVTRKADLLFMASKDLAGKKMRFRESSLRSAIGPEAITFLVPNGVDYQGIRDAAKSSRPPEMEKIPSPIIGHIGLIGPHSDSFLIRFLAVGHPEWSFVFVGPVSGASRSYEDLRRLPNVYFLGSKPAAHIPFYLHAFDVCAFFYPLGHGNESRNSMKLYLYLASGKPIVSYHLAGAQDIPRHLIYLASAPEDFSQQIMLALNERDPMRAEERLRYAQRNSWDKRAGEVHGIIAGRLAA